MFLLSVAWGQPLEMFNIAKSEKSTGQKHGDVM